MPRSGAGRREVSGDPQLVASSPVLFVDLSRGGVKTLADRGEDVLMLRAVRLGLRDVGLFGLFELDAHAVQATFALMTMGLRDNDTTA